ncbi:hypothetical protein C8R44DRAFT_795574 [Mycena epipterygia]|nr:hypothetical protein C8R44DRAFT_795574 [Mycena epipterygia]
MGKAKGRVWDFFHEEDMQNLSHHRAYCLGCVETHRQFAASTLRPASFTDDNPLEFPEPLAPGRSVRWLPCPLSRLFGGTIAKPPQSHSRRAFTEEERLMELLGAEHSDEELDDGELEGSGDDYDEE